MTPSTKMRAHVIGAATAGLALRLFFIRKFPFYDSGDTQLYEQLARNWLNHGVYGFYISGQLVPVDMRAPGYPAFLAVIYGLLGHSPLAVMLTQGLVDTASCFLIAVLAGWVAPDNLRRRVGLAALWLATLCPLTANYTAAVLSEVLAVFLTALALVILLASGGLVDVPRQGYAHKVSLACFLGGLATGLGTLVRPETALLLIAVVLVLLARCRQRQNWSKAARAGLWMTVGLFLSLLPWAARNWITLHKVQFLAARYSQLPGEYVPRGFYAWTNTWLWRFRDVYLVPWKLDDEELSIEDLPPAAFDNPAERERVGELFERYNETTTMSPSVDNGFAELARERTARHPLRTYISVPIKRAFAMWFTPRIELLPFSGHLWPPGKQWEEDRVDFSVTIFFGLLNFLYVGLAIAGAWIARRRPAVAFLVTFVLLRTAFFTRIETPEPRYMLECFPAILALAAQLWMRSPSKT
jgi:4-amino-4-deoxy-L-arabinose transferase-like glycosyltransferase